MTMTNFPNGVSSFGIPMAGNGIPATSGTVIFVDADNGSDSVSLKSNSIKRGFKTVAKAYDVATTNKDDVIALSANASHVLTEMLTVAKNRVHFVGLDGAGRMYGQGAKIALGITGVATNLGTILNTGVRNSFQNIKFTNADTVAQGLYTFLDGGEYMFMANCEIYKSTLLTTTLASELVMNGDSAQIVNSTIGSLADPITTAIIRANVRMTKGLAGTGLVARDVIFKNCNFWKKAGDVANRFVYGANGTDVERMLLFDNCVFLSQALSTAAPAQCVAFGAAQTAGTVLIRNCTSVGNTKLSTTTGVFVDGAVPTAATSGISVQAA